MSLLHHKKEQFEKNSILEWTWTEQKNIFHKINDDRIFDINISLSIYLSIYLSISIEYYILYVYA